MIEARCPACSAPIEPAQEVCPRCGEVIPVGSGASTQIDLSRGSTSERELAAPVTDETVAVTRPHARSSSTARTERGQARGDVVSGELGFLATVHRSGSHSAAASGGATVGELAIGRVLAGRYRVLGLLGKGGMGEVYRAEDMLLAQTVAVKLLPRELAADPEYLSRLLNEVRVARQVTHPNVCRVHDIGEADGRHFLSMEYIDGEDLSTLLRRIGHLSVDKGSDLARQLCLGLHAAHERGVLHRDLKPANVMLDGDGNVRITDFGLAVVGDMARRVHAREGTPAYMAPEQIEGSHVSARSDIYALGLVLYEVYTGRYALDERGRRSSASHKSTRTGGGRVLPRAPSDIIKGLDKSVSAVVMRCLDPSPERRPQSALEVAAALPGGDPLAAALAAGYTPSADTVADGGSVGGIGFGLALLLIVLFIVGLGAVALLTERTRPYGVTPAGIPTAALEHEAAEVLAICGVDDVPVDRMTRLNHDYPLIDAVRSGEIEEPWLSDQLSRPGGLLRLGYRHGRDVAGARQVLSGIERQDLPDVSRPGDAIVYVDGGGRLQSLKVVPDGVDRASETAADGAPVDWTRLLRRTGFALASLEPIEPAFVPPVYADQRYAWTLADAGVERAPARIEAASLDGRPVYLEVLRPWSARWEADGGGRAGAGARSMHDPSIILAIVVVGVALLAAMWIGLIAARSFRSGEGDRTGARRFSGVVGALDCAGRLLLVDHVAVVRDEGLLLAGVAASSVAVGALSWVMYMVVEPYARRYWPHAVTSWSRLVRGRLRDRLVGRDLLIGSAVGVWLAVLLYIVILTGGGVASHHPINEILPPAMFGGRFVLGALFHSFLISMWELLFVCSLLLVARLLLRRQWLAVASFAVLWVARVFLHSPGTWALAMLPELAYLALLLLLVLRFGILATFVALLCRTMTLLFPLTSEPWRWYADLGLVGVGVAVALVGYGSFRAVGGLAVLDELVEE